MLRPDFTHDHVPPVLKLPREVVTGAEITISGKQLILKDQVRPFHQRPRLGFAFCKIVKIHIQFYKIIVMCSGI